MLTNGVVPMNRALRGRFAAVLPVMMGLAIALQTLPSHASVIAEEQFNYSSGSSIVGQNGGTGWSGAWTNDNSFFSNQTIGSSSLGYSGLSTLGGDAVGSGSGTNATGTADGRNLTAESNTYGNVLWLSFLGAMTADGGGFNNLRLIENGALQAGIGSNGASNPDWLIFDSPSSLSATTTTPINGSAHLVLAEIDYLTGQTTLWMDPSVAAFNGTQAASTTLAAAPVFNRVGLYLRTGNSLDEITLATTYQEALHLSAPTPAPEPPALSVLLPGLLALAGIVLRRPGAWARG